MEVEKLKQRIEKLRAVDLKYFPKESKDTEKI